MRITTQPVEIRLADEDDLSECLRLDDSYTSSHTWQMEAARGEPGAAPYSLSSSMTLGDGPVHVVFRPVKLPRARKIAGQVANSMHDGNETSIMSRLQQWKSADAVLIAEQGSKLCGYVVITVVPGSGIGWISALVVANSVRRKGVGSMLLGAARRWARYGQGQNVRAFMLEVPTKNYPAVAFCASEGFTFCGYTDYSFSNGDIVLLFVSPVVI